MLVKNALRVMNRFGIVQMRPMDSERTFYLLPASPWMVTFVGETDGQVSDIRVYFGEINSYVTKVNLNEALRYAFNRSRAIRFTYLNQQLRCDAALRYLGAQLRPTIILNVEDVPTAGRGTILFRHRIVSHHPQAVIMLKEVIDGADPGPLLDWLQDQGGPEIEAFIASLVSPGGDVYHKEHAR